MTDRFYRATQALKSLEKYWEGKPVFERQSALTEDEKLKILDLLSHNVNKADVESLPPTKLLEGLDRPKRDIHRFPRSVPK